MKETLSSLVPTRALDAHALANTELGGSCAGTARRGVARSAVRVGGSRTKAVALNKRWRGKDKPTNVLPLPAPWEGRYLPATWRTLGDLVICAKVVRDEAGEHGKLDSKRIGRT